MQPDAEHRTLGSEAIDRRGAIGAIAAVGLAAAPLSAALGRSVRGARPGPVVILHLAGGADGLCVVGRRGVEQDRPACASRVRWGSPVNGVRMAESLGVVARGLEHDRARAERIISNSASQAVTHEIAERALRERSAPTHEVRASGRLVEDALDAARLALESPAHAARVWVRHPGWDTHTEQPERIAGLLDELGGAIERLDAARVGPFGLPLLDRVSVVVVSELGRSERENACGSTDHGPVSMRLVLGPAAQRA